MSELFKSYEQQFINTLAPISKKIQSIPVQTNRNHQTKTEKKQLAFVDIKQDLTQSQKLIKFMETQVGGLDVQIKFEFNKKIRQYKKDLEQVRKKLYKAQQQFAFEKSKQMLMGAQLDQQKSSTNKQKLIKNGQMLSDTNYKLKNSVAVMHQTLDISNNIGIELQDQTLKMKSNKQKLITMQDDISSAQRKIKNIFLRMKKNKLILIGTFCAIIIIIIIALVVKFK